MKKFNAGAYPLQFGGSAKTKTKETGNKTIEILQHTISYYYRDGRDMPECEQEHVQEMIIEGYNLGELCYYDVGIDSEIRGWWHIKKGD